MTVKLKAIEWIVVITGYHETTNAILFALDVKLDHFRNWFALIVFFHYDY